MKLRAQQLATWLRSSFWFLPGSLVCLGALLAIGLVELEELVTASWVLELPWVFSGGADGARGLLSAIASSMVTVTGVTFSITVVALTLAAQQYTPRLLREFTADRGNQVVLGAFLATFVYALLVLRSIRAESFGAFVPHVAVTGAVVMALISVGLLVYFIHHVTASLRPDTILGAVTRQARALIDHLFPERLGERAPDHATSIETEPSGAGLTIPARHTGYVQAVDVERLMQIAESEDLLLRMEVHMGEFVFAGRPLLTLWPPERGQVKSQNTLCRCFAVGDVRTGEQDLEFAVVQIVDIAVKALSPGINDPTTANNCLDYLGDLLQHLGQRHVPSPNRSGKDGRLRVIATGTSFERVAGLALDEIRRYAEGSAGVTIHLLRTLERVSACLDQPDRVRVLREHVRRTSEGAEATIQRSADLAEVRHAVRNALAATDHHGEHSPIIKLAS
ncbi:MAG: DUF2254 domain-containing protein [Actinomycetota bacterium]